jgi:hypothetical protein
MNNFNFNAYAHGNGSRRDDGGKNLSRVDMHYARGVAVAAAAATAVPVEEDPRHRRTKSASGGILGAINRQVKKFADPDMQFAGLMS